MLQRTFWGLLLIAAGVIFLLDRMGLITVDFSTLIRTYWPVFIIIAGASGFLSSFRYGWGAGIWNLIVMGVGVIFLLHNLGVTGLSIGELFAYLGPAALILFGLSVMFKPASKETHKEQDPFRHPDRSYYEIYGNKPPGIDGTNESDKAKEAWKGHAKSEKWERRRARYDWHERQRHHEQEVKHEYINTFGPESGGTQHKSGFIGDVVLGKDYWDLQPMAISHFIGDTLIDLTKATIPYGETKIVVSTFVGDVKMLVPADLDVEISVTASSFVGDMHVLERHETGMCRNIRTETPYYAESERKIRLIVSSFVGDVIVRKVG